MGKNKAIPTNQTNPCPICDNSKGHCRHIDSTDGYFVLCWTNSSARLLESVAGYRCVKEASGREWATFAPISNEVNPDDLNRRRQERELVQQREREELAKGALPIEDRDRAIRTIHRHFGLSARHREDLRIRGLSDEAIDNRLYFSITPNQEVPHSIPANLPGVSYGQIKAAGTGYACVTFDPESRATGWQVRLDDVQDNKYRWAKGARSSHLASGELPITSTYPIGDIRRHAIGVCEGVSKPGIAANRLGQVFIGASSANFASSPEQTREYLLAASERLGTKQIEFAADAGAVSNPHILSSYRRSWELFAKLGYEVRVSWWGQVQKDAPDIDELQPEQIDQILLLTVSEFEAICREHGGLPKEGFARGVKRQIERNIQKFVEKLTPKPEKRGFEETEPDPAEYAAYLQQEQEQLEAELAESREHQQQKKQDYPARAKAAWRKARRFTADIQKATQWFEADQPPENSIFFGRSGLGSGKTRWLCKQVEKWKQQGKGFFCLGYRNTLLHQLCSDEKDENGEPKGLDFYHIQHKDAALMQRDPNNGIALCVDSLWRFNPEDFDGKIVILDEVMSVIRHLLHSDTIKGRDNILELFRQAILRSSQVVCLDGNLADWAVKYLNQLAPDKKIIRHENTYHRNKARINYLLGTIDIDEKLKANDRSPWLHYLLNESRVPAICTDSQVFAESLDNLLSKKGLKVLRIDSKTVPEDYIKECLKNSNAYIERNRPDVVIYTPSAESGVDVSISDYFTHHFAFFFGVLGVDAISQMLGRIRDSKCTKYVWVREWVAQSERSHSRSPFVKSVGKAVEQVLVQDITDTITGIERDKEVMTKLWGIIQQSKNPHFETSNQIQAIDNYEKGNLRECVLEALTDAGYSIECCTLTPKEGSKTLVKKATEATKRQNCHEIFTAEKIDADYAEDLSKSMDCKWEDRVKIINALYRKRLPGIDATESWTEDFIYKVKYENPDFISQQEIFWLFKHPNESNRMNLERYHKMAAKEHTFIGNIRSRAAKVKALRDIGIEWFITPNNAWHEDSPELVKLVKRCKNDKVAAALGRHPGQQKNIRFLGGLLKILGLKHTGQKVRSEDGDYRIYQLDLDILNDPDRLIALQCLDTRWANYLTKEVEILNWDLVLDSQEVATIENETYQKGTNSLEQEKQAQTLTQQALDTVPRTPSEYIYIESFLEQDKSHDVVVDEVAQLPLPTPVDALKFALETCQSVSQFVALTEGYSLDQIDKAIALSDSQPRRRELTELWEISQDCRVLRSVSSWGEIQLNQERLNKAWETLEQTERDRLHNLYQESIEKPVEVCETEPIVSYTPLSDYVQGQEVWFYHPKAEAKWIRGIVEWTRDRMVRVKSGFLGMLIEREDLIAPGHWQLSSG